MSRLRTLKDMPPTEYHDSLIILQAAFWPLAGEPSWSAVVAFIIFLIFGGGNESETYKLSWRRLKLNGRVVRSDSSTGLIRILIRRKPW